MLARQCGNHFAIYTNVESLHCIPEINNIMYIDYIAIKCGGKPNLYVHSIIHNSQKIKIKTQMSIN